MGTNDEENIEGRNGSSRRKIHSTQRDLWLKPLLKLKQQEDIIERGIVTAIGNMKIDGDLLKDIVHEQREITSKRQTFLNSMYRSIEDIANEMESAKRVTKDPEELKKLDVDTYKLKLIKFWQKMQDFKKSCSIDTLVEEQNALGAELREFVPQLEKYENVQKNILSSCQNLIENRKERKDYGEVEDFHELVARTGHMNNWTSEDHLYFLKMRKKCDKISALVAAIKKKCPDLSTVAIVNHEIWYKRYTNLREKQKSAIKEWRQRKELEKTKSVDEFRSTESCFEDDLNEDEKTVTSKQKRASRAEASRSNRSADSNESEKKELIKKWRMEKENKRTMDEEQMKVRMKMKRETEEKQRRKRRERIQEALEEYKKKKYFENASRESSADSKGKCTYDSALVKAFRKQDEEYTKRRKDLILRSQKSHKIEITEEKRSELLKNRSFSTLLNSTAVWREKCKDESPVRRSNELLYIKDIPKVCFRWRNEESGDLKNMITFD
ncbi:coiled-coil domain-containing protein 112-like [Colletes gigas]|uniref:coiled-coil domain-containing protein 112-like n=1 Tax=Colletes gigas TaxID=935657 RepID=UPI001C9A4649|nr:coiled-coil domain-containing protein 112-like [Colletes gigas]